MAVERAAATTSVTDVLDRVLDKGIVIDAWVRVSLIGISVLTVEARIVVASIETHLRHADLATQLRMWSLPALEPAAWNHPISTGLRPTSVQRVSKHPVRMPWQPYGWEKRAGAPSR